MVGEETNHKLGGEVQDIPWIAGPNCRSHGNQVTIDEIDDLLGIPAETPQQCVRLAAHRSLLNACPVG